MRSPFLMLATLLLCAGVFFALRDKSAADRGPAPEPRHVTGPGETPIPTEITFEPLESDGVLGGRATTLLPGSPEEIHAAITDFQQAPAHRSFARKIELLSSQPDQIEAALTLEGKLGVSPTIHVLYKTLRAEGQITITYELTRKAFGVARYFGSYHIEALPGVPSRSRFRSTLFISSGISLASVDHDEIEAGQRRDQQELRAWMRARLSLPR